jgi:hypothetical protein
LPEPAATVRSITVYPLKSCRGISVPQAAITATGTILHSFCAVARGGGKGGLGGAWHPPCSRNPYNVHLIYMFTYGHLVLI